jgi:Putative adhesin
MSSRLHRFGALACVVALVLISGGYSWGQQAPAPAPAAADNQERFSRTFPLNSGGTLDIKNYKGAIRIEGTDANQAVVEVWKRYEGNSERRQHWLESTRVDFSNSPSRLSVHVEYAQNWCAIWCGDNEYGAVELTVRVPRRTTIELDGYKPEIKIANTDGDIRIKSYKSPIELHSTGGGIDIDTYKETVRLEDVAVRGRLHIDMYKGDALIQAKSLAGDADLSTYKGDFTVRLPADARFNVDVSHSSRRAQFNSDFPITTSVTSSDAVRGTVNGGGPLLRFRSERGTLRLERVR